MKQRFKSSDLKHLICLCFVFALHLLVAVISETAAAAATTTTTQQSANHQLFNATKSSDIQQQQQATPKTSLSVSTSIVQSSSSVPIFSSSYAHNNHIKLLAPVEATVSRFRTEDALSAPFNEQQRQSWPPNPQIQTSHVVQKPPTSSVANTNNGRIIDYSNGGGGEIRHYFHHHYVHQPQAASQAVVAASLPATTTVNNDQLHRQLFAPSTLNSHHQAQALQGQIHAPSYRPTSSVLFNGRASSSNHNNNNQLQDYQGDAPAVALSSNDESQARSYGSPIAAASSTTNGVNNYKQPQQALEHWQSRRAKCPTRSLGSILKSNIMFGSGLLAAAIPLIALVLPDSSSSSGSSLPKRSAAGLLGHLVSAVTSGNGGFGGGSGGLQGRVESMMGWVERSIEHLPHFPRLHPQECVKRSICEAHNEPDKYGAIGLALRVMFPASNLNSTDQMDNMEYKVINKYRHAASFGFTKRIDQQQQQQEGEAGQTGNTINNVAVCKDKYEDCLVSLLDVAQKLVDLFII